MPASSPRPPGPILFLGTLLALGACSSGPRVTPGPRADPSGARGLLVSAAQAGPVPLEVDAVPPVYQGGAGEVAAVATRAVEWLNTRFIAASFGGGSTAKRLVFRFQQGAGSPLETCAGRPMAGSMPAPPVRLQAVFCDGLRPVADVSGTADGPTLDDTDQMVVAVMDRLFPGRSGGPSYGYPGVSLGVGIGGGHGGFGSGIFGGLHF